MKILSAEQIKELDKHTIKTEPIASIDLMERASAKFADWFAKRFNLSKKIMVFCGPGNNGGDGLAIARMLLQQGYQVEVFAVQAFYPSDEFKINQARLGKQLFEITTSRQIPWLAGTEIIIDAIFGSGLNKNPQGVFADTIKAINKSNATIVSVDVASGLYCDQPTDHEFIIEADFTFTFQIPKLSQLMPQYAPYVGELTVADIGLDKEFQEQTTTNYFYLTDCDIRSKIRKRKKISHKGNYGHALMIAGSYGMMGASVLSTKACVKSGAGLTTAYIPECGFHVIQSTVPEAIVLTDPNFDHITAVPEMETYNVIGIGPGLKENKETVAALSTIFSQVKVPMVIDASALNILSTYPGMQSSVPRNSVLTPHPGELKRLVGDWKNDYEKNKKAIELAQKLRSIIVLKGAHSAIITPEGNIYFNSTGNPGMASGGSGDVLTGIITSLIAQGYEPLEAAQIGVFMHGYAGDVTASEMGEPAVTASDIIGRIGTFYKKFY